MPPTPLLIGTQGTFLTPTKSVELKNCLDCLAIVEYSFVSSITEWPQSHVWLFVLYSCLYCTLQLPSPNLASVEVVLIFLAESKL